MDDTIRTIRGTIDRKEAIRRLLCLQMDFEVNDEQWCAYYNAVDAIQKMDFTE